jgi:hypothetical protein
MAPPGDDHKVPLGAVSSCNRIGCDILAAVDAINMDYEPATCPANQGFH